MEKHLQDKIISIAKDMGALAYKVEAVSSRGFPDVLVILQNGVVAFIEVKHPNKAGRVSPSQQRTIKKMQGNNANVYIISDIFTARTILCRLNAAPARTD